MFKKKKKKGFTLVELLAVIVILAVVILIAVTAVIPIMNKAKKKAFIDEALVYFKAAEEAYAFDDDSGSSCINITDLNDNYVKKSSDTYTGTITTEFTNGNYVQTINLTNGKYYLISSSTDVSVDDVKDSMPQGFTSSCGNHNSIIAQCPSDVPLTSCEVNVAPTLTGVSAVDITHTGKNLIDDTLANLEQGTIGGNAGTNQNASNRVRNATMYSFPYDDIRQDYTLTIPSGYKLAIRCYDENGNYVYTAASHTGFINSLPSNLVGQGVKYVRFVFAKTDDSDITPEDIKNLGFQIEIGSNTTTYEPYIQPTTHTANLGRTIYGGSVDVARGTGTDNYINITFDGSESGWRFGTSSDKNRVYIELSNAKASVGTFVGNYIEPLNSAQGYPPEWKAWINASSQLVIGVPSTITSKAEWQAYLAQNNLIVSYEKATPTNFAFTPINISSSN